MCSQTSIDILVTVSVFTSYGSHAIHYFSHLGARDHAIRLGPRLFFVYIDKNSCRFRLVDFIAQFYYDFLIVVSAVDNQSNYACD